jgi:hypothetical protein
VVNFTLGPKTLVIHWIGGWVGFRAGLDAVEKRKIPRIHSYSDIKKEH